ncbi:MAG: hypothetical protein ACXVMS_15090 [Flavisolibacter sp.]
MFAYQTSEETIRGSYPGTRMEIQILAGGFSLNKRKNGIPVPPDLEIASDTGRGCVSAEE